MEADTARLNQWIQVGEMAKNKTRSSAAQLLGDVLMQNADRPGVLRVIATMQEG